MFSLHIPLSLWFLLGIAGILLMSLLSLGHHRLLNEMLRLVMTLYAIAFLVVEVNPFDTTYWRRTELIDELSIAAVDSDLSLVTDTGRRIELAGVRASAEQLPQAVLLLTGITIGRDFSARGIAGTGRFQLACGTFDPAAELLRHGVARVAPSCLQEANDQVCLSYQWLTVGAEPQPYPFIEQGAVISDHGGSQ